MIKTGLFKMRQVKYYADDINPASNLGMQLVHLNESLGNPDLLCCNEGYSPLIMKLDHFLYSFRVNAFAPNLGYRPSDSYWFKLESQNTVELPRKVVSGDREVMGEETSPWALEGILERTLKPELESALHSSGKDVAVFSTGTGKLGVLVEKDGEIKVAYGVEDYRVCRSVMMDTLPINGREGETPRIYALKEVLRRLSEK